MASIFDLASATPPAVDNSPDNVITGNNNQTGDKNENSSSDIISSGGIGNAGSVAPNRRTNSDVVSKDVSGLPSRTGRPDEGSGRGGSGSVKSIFDLASDTPPEGQVNSIFDLASDEPPPNPRQEYIDQQKELQNRTGLQKAGDFATSALTIPVKAVVAGAHIISEIPQAAATAAEALPFAGSVVGQQNTENARQDILNNLLKSTTDTRNMVVNNVPKFKAMVSGKKFTDEELGGQYDEMQKQQQIRDTITHLGENPEVLKQLQNGNGLAKGIAGTENLAIPSAQKGTVTVNPERQENTSDIFNAGNLIPFGEGTGLVKGLATRLGIDLANTAERGILENALRRGASKALEGTGSVAKGVSQLGEAIASVPGKLTKAVIEDPELQELTKNRIGKAVSLTGIGHIAGIPHAGAIAAIPSIAGATGDMLKTAAKAVAEEPGSLGFFERMAQNSSGISKQVYRTLDNWGGSRTLAALGRAGKEAGVVGIANAPVSAVLSGNDPEQFANSVASNASFGALGSLYGEHGYNDRPEVIKAKQAQDFRELVKSMVANGQGVEAANLVPAQAEFFYQKVKAQNPNMPEGKARSMAAAMATDGLGKMAQVIRTNPDATWRFNDSGIPMPNGTMMRAQTGAFGVHEIGPDGRSIINLDINDPNLISKTLGHEYTHHLDSQGLLQPTIDNLTGNPELGTKGTIDTNPNIKAAFDSFKKNYKNAIDAMFYRRIKASGDPTEKANLELDRQRQQTFLGNDRNMAREFLSEGMGAILSGTTKNGELNYSRLRRASAADKLTDRLLGTETGALQPNEMGFLDAGMKFDPRELLDKNTRGTVTNYLRNREYLRSAGKEYQAPSATDRTYNESEVKRNPALYEKVLGADPAWTFGKDAQGNVISAKKNSLGQQRKIVAEKSKTILANMAKDPTLGTVTDTPDVTGKISKVLTDLTPKFYDMLQQSGLFNPTQIANIKRMADAINNGQGETFNTMYQAALTKGQYGQIPIKNHQVSPYEMFISQPEGKEPPNLLVRIADLTEAHNNFTKLVDAINNAKIQSPYNDINKAMADLKVAMQNQGRGYGATGEQIKGAPQPAEAALTRPDGTKINDQEKNFLNLMLGVNTQDAGANYLRNQIKPGDLKQIRSAIKSLRMDRINTMESSDIGNHPTDYGAIKGNYRPEEAVKNPEFMKWHTGSKVVDENGLPKIVYSGHSNVAMYGDKFDPKKGTAGGFYATEDPKIVSNYATNKMGNMESYEGGDQYRFQQKNGKFEKKMWQIELTPEQQQKAREFLGNEEGVGLDLDDYWKRNAPFDKDAKMALMRGGMRDLQSIFKTMESMGYNLTHSVTDEKGQTDQLASRQAQSMFDDLLDHVGLKWDARDKYKPGVMPVYLSIKNPIDTHEPMNPELMKALETAANRERPKEFEGEHWTKDYPMKEFVNDIKTGNEYWSTQVPTKAMEIFKKYGYDGIKERGSKGSTDPNAYRQINWIAFDPQQIKSAIGNKGTFDPQNPNMMFRPGELNQNTLPERPETIQAQLAMLQNGTKNALLIPQGSDDLKDKPKGFTRVVTKAGIFYMNPERVKRVDVLKAVKEDRIGDILGYGISRKPTKNLVGAVTVRDQNGIEKHAVATDQENLQNVIKAAKRVQSAGDVLSLENPEQVINERLRK